MLCPAVVLELFQRQQDAAKCARACSNATGPRGLLKRRAARASFKKQFTQLLERIPLAQGQILLISCEALVGRMPGRDKVMGFDAAASLAKDMRDVVQKHFGSDVDLTFLYTTRSQNTWMRSAYSHLLQKSRFTLTEDEFTKRYARAGDLAKVLADIARTVAPCPVVESRLEITSPQAFGPASELVKLLNLPSELVATLTPAKQVNKRLDQFEQDKMRALNMLDADDEELDHKKRRFLRKRRKRLRRRQENL